MTPDQKALILRNFSDLESALRRGELVHEVRKKMGLKPILYAGEGTREEDRPWAVVSDFGWSHYEQGGLFEATGQNKEDDMVPLYPKDILYGLRVTGGPVSTKTEGDDFVWTVSLEAQRLSRPPDAAEPVKVQVVFARFSGACEQYRVRGFVVGKDGRPDLERDVYAGDWCSRDAADEELRFLAGEE